MSVAFTREESAETAAGVLFVALATALKCSIASCLARKSAGVMLCSKGRGKLALNFACC